MPMPWPSGTKWRLIRRWDSWGLCRVTKKICLTYLKYGLDLSSRPPAISGRQQEHT